MTIFIVEDDPWYGELLKHSLSVNPDFDVTLLNSGKDCLDNMFRRPDVICIDFGLPDVNGVELLSSIQAIDKSIPVIVISGQEQVSVVLKLLKMGATEYILKDENTKDVLWNSLIRIRETRSLKKEVEELKAQLENKFSFGKTLIGQSPAIQKTFSIIEKAANSNINVSITGETGTGKEVVAKAIHFNSERRKKPFIAVNMAAIPAELIESELFGHEKGAFTGAVGRRTGKFEDAYGGTIFLDEIGEMDLSLQAKLLRVLQERELTRVGGSEVVRLDVRIIIATNKDLAALVRKGSFREDLFYRVMGLTIALPPLRERGDDILAFAKFFAEEHCRANRTKLLTLSAGAREKLMKYNYPGNVRELKAMIDLACVMANGDQITAEDISFHTAKPTQEFTAIEKTLHEYNCDIIAFYLKKYNNNVVEVARRLGIGKSTIYNLIKKNEVRVS